jgi:hypothetical protein
VFTYKFAGLLHADNPGPYYYGSLPVMPEVGHVLYYDETGNRYQIVRIVGQGLEGKDTVNQHSLAVAEIVHAKDVPTIYLKKLPPSQGPKKTDIEPTGTSYYDDLKKASQTNRRKRKKGG